MTRAEKEWEVYSGKYRTYIKTERGLAANTVEAYMRDLRRFRRFVTERYRLSPLEVETPVVEEFLNSLFEAGAEKSTQNRTLSGVSSFYDFLLRTDVLEKSPAEFVERPKSGHYLPDTLSIEEIDAILDAIDVSTAHGYRNRTMIEMLYSCGLRVSELTSLHISDLFFDEGFIRVLGKGSKQRLIPVSDRCRMQVETYLREGFQVLASFPGRKLSRIMVFNAIKAAAAAAGIDKEVSPHTFRHSFATHLLAGGANIRQVQELLGHESITTTEIYTHLDTGRLHAALNEHHPLGKRYRER